jgi:hypothetical protein
MNETLTAPLFELAHIKTEDLRHLARPAPGSPLPRVAAMGLGLLTGLAATLLVWRRIRR